MKAVRWLTIALALSVPSTLLAQGAEDDPEMRDDEMSRDDQVSRDDDISREEQVAREEEQRRRDYREMQDRPMDRESAQSEKTMKKVKSQIVPAVAGIEAADKAVAALYELSGADTLDPSDARSTVLLAREGVQMAIDRTEDLDKISGLSSDARSELDRASTKLRDAKMTLQRLDKHVGKKEARISRNQVEQIREHARDLHTDLSDAENAVERVAKAYDVSTDLELEG